MGPLSVAFVAVPPSPRGRSLPRGQPILSRRESDRLFRQVDTNGDGVIAGNELSNVTLAVLGDMCSDMYGRRPGSAERR